jgi:hypothetical protein
VSKKSFFTVQLFQIVCCCYCYQSHRPEDLANCYHYAIMQLLLCVLLFSQWSKYAVICHCCMPQTCNARCWPIIAPTTTTFEWSSAPFHEDNSFGSNITAINWRSGFQNGAGAGTDHDDYDGFTLAAGEAVDAVPDFVDADIMGSNPA